MVTCIYHRVDFDGIGSAAVVKSKYPDAKFIGYNYGDPIPEIEEGKLFMVDVSMPIEEMIKLGKKCEMVWIDHHKTAIERYFAFTNDKHGVDFFTMLDTSLSACELTWKFIYPDKPVNKIIELLGRYDRWDNKDKEEWENNILPFQYGMRMICKGIDNFPIDFLKANEDSVKEFIDDTIPIGNNILQYQRQIDERVCKCAFEREFEGHRAICLNTGGFNSQSFSPVWDEEKYDIMMPFQFNGKHWVVSLYTTKNIDCSAIATKYGKIYGISGGGHPQAAGFIATDLKFIGV